MWAPSLGSGRRTGHRRIADYLTDDLTDASDNESITAHSEESFAGVGGDVAGGMLPEFLADQGDLVEVMLELDEESMVVRSVTPTDAALYAPTVLSAGARTPDGGSRSLSRCSSTTSRIRRKFTWLRSPSASRRHSNPPAADQEEAARERRRAKARLDRSRPGARRALKGLRFISHTTAGGGSARATPAELWRGVEERFNLLSRDGLLARDDFGECIGTATGLCSVPNHTHATRSYRWVAGMAKSEEFAVGVFDALARRRRQNLERITKDELYEFWLQISDQSFDVRLQIFFDMCAPSSHPLAIHGHHQSILSVLTFVAGINPLQGGHQRGRQDHEGGSAGGNLIMR
jgi:respiratory burst oxidase